MNNISTRLKKKKNISSVTYTANITRDSRNTSNILDLNSSFYHFIWNDCNYLDFYRYVNCFCMVGYKLVGQLVGF